MVPQFARVIVVFLLALGCARLSDAGGLMLAWDPPEEGVPTGYIVFYGTASGSYSNQLDVGNVTSYTVIDLSVGTYYFAVRAYDTAGTLSDFSNEVSGTVYGFLLMTSLAVTANVPPPFLIGTAASWVASASGGWQPYEFQWALYQGGSWTVGPWTTTSTWTWTPSAAGTDYQIRVSARSAGSTSQTGELTQSVPFTVTGPPPPPGPSVTLKANVASPQLVGSTVRWSAATTGGGAPYQYRWWVFDGSVWRATTDWSNSSTWSWTARVANDKYVVRVWVRSAGQTANAAEASASVPFPIIKPAKGEQCKGPKCK